MFEHLSFKKQFDNKELAQKVLGISFTEVTRYGFWTALIIMIFELLMIARVLFVGLGDAHRNYQYLVCYVFLFSICGIIAVFIPIWKKDIKRYGRHIYIMEKVFTIAITAWAIVITLLDGVYHDYFDVVVYMTIMLIAPIICFLNPYFLVLVKLFGDVVILSAIIGLGYVGSAINFSVYALISVFACLTIQKSKKEMYINQCKLIEKAMRDPLTGILNRQTLHDDGLKVWGEGLKAETPVSVIMLDVDHFKQINDNYGHQVGDYCIQRIADVLQKICEQEHDSCYRYGGEEFLILLPNTGSEKAIEVTEKIMRDIQIVFANNPYGISVTASYGIYSGIPGESESIELYYSKADKLLYHSKENGRNQYTVGIQ